MQGKLSPACDVYSLGMLLWEMCASQRMFAGMALPSIQEFIAMRKPLPRLPQGLPSGLQVKHPPALAGLY